MIVFGLSPVNNSDSDQYDTVTFYVSYKITNRLIERFRVRALLEAKIFSYVNMVTLQICLYYLPNTVGKKVKSHVIHPYK